MWAIARFLGLYLVLYRGRRDRMNLEHGTAYTRRGAHEPYMCGTCVIHVLNLSCMCAAYVLCMYCTCALQVYMYPTCAPNVLYMCSTCAQHMLNMSVHAPCMCPTCSPCVLHVCICMCYTCALLVI